MGILTDQHRTARTEPLTCCLGALLSTHKQQTNHPTKRGSRGERGLDIYKGYQAIPTPIEASMVAIGNYDGVHKGHRAVLEQLVTEAQRRGIPSLVYTFQPHPVKVLAPAQAPPLINTYAQKRTLLASLGIDIMVEEPFHMAFAGYSPERFVAEVLNDALGAKGVFVGYDFTFGKGGKANVDTLRTLGAPFDMGVYCLDALTVDGIVASSTKIRRFVQEGQLKAAADLLMRPFSLSGQVVKGDQRGRTIGFPTANINTSQELMPPHGVYACWVQRDDEQGTHMHPAAVNIGKRPTFKDEHAAPTVEAHLLDVQADLYDQTLTLHFQERLREERSFPSADALKEQIQSDVQQARAALVTPPDVPYALHSIM